MLRWCRSLGPRTRSGRTVAAIILSAYVAVLLQPCAMAMGQAPTQHPASCQDVPADSAHELCLSQPAVECATEDWNVDGRNPTVPDFAPLAAPVIFTLSAELDANRAGREYKPLHAPPPGEPALPIRHCVFLK